MIIRNYVTFWFCDLLILGNLFSSLYLSKSYDFMCFTNLGFLSVNKLMFSDFLIRDRFPWVSDLAENKLFEIANGFSTVLIYCAMISVFY